MNLILTMGGGSQKVSFIRPVSKTNIASKNNLVGSIISNIDSQYFKSGVVYISTVQGGIEKRGNNNRPEKRDKEEE